MFTIAQFSYGRRQYPSVWLCSGIRKIVPAVFCAQSKNGVKADVRELLSIAEVELQWLVLSEELLRAAAAEARVRWKDCARK